MKKLFILLPVVFALSANAQNKKEVANFLESQKIEILLKQKATTPPLKFNLSNFDKENLKKYLVQNNIKLSVEEFVESELKKNKISLTSFVGNVPVYNKLYDVKANKAANVDILYNGNVNGSSTPVTGNGINITVVDGGSILNHVEFSNATDRIQLMDYQEADVTDSTSLVDYHFHATNVAGVIGASGVDANAKGVLTNAKFKSYAFTTTEVSGNNYQKTFNSDFKLSNHSYGSNLGYGISNFIYALFGYVIYPLPIEPLTDNTKTYSGTYYAPDYNWDIIVDTDPNHVIVKAAGNSFGDNENTVVYGTPTTFVGFDIYGNQYQKAIGTVNDSATIAVESLPAGNCEGNNPCIDFGSLAKNIITVGSIEQFADANDNRYTGASNVQYASYSSAGPRKDGAIKPDISTVGSNVYMPSVGNNNSILNSYETSSGTSYSSPLVTAVIGALTQFQRDLTGNATFNFKADDAKNLITHTAQESGLFPGPDVFAGWGIIDGNKAAEVLVDKVNNEAILETINFQNGTTKTYEVYGKANTPLKASISWIDPAADFITDETTAVYELLVNDTSNKLVNDFDLRIIDTETNEVFFPWKLDVASPRAAAVKGDNNVDNVEQVLIDQPIENRKYRIEITHKNNLVNHNRQISNRDINVLVTGYSPRNLAVNDLLSKEISIYPTKTKDVINFKNVKSESLVDIYTINGQKVKSVKINAKNQIDLTGFNAGVYVVNVESDGKLVSKKVIKY